MNSIVGVVSGHTLAGKSRVLKHILARPQFAGSPVVSMDHIRCRIWGPDADLTREGHRYKNELTRREIEQVLITQRPRSVIVEMAMLTRTYHQQPLVAMVRNASRIMRIIEEEEALRDGIPPPSFGDIHLRVVLLFCNQTAFRRNAAHRDRDKEATRATGTNAFGVAAAAESLVELELPVDYEPLIVNTSDEAREEERLAEITQFFTDGTLPGGHDRRRGEFLKTLEQNRASFL